MHKYLKNIEIASKVSIIISLFILFPISGYSDEPTISIHIRGVYECKISLIALNGFNASRSVIVSDSIKNGETTILQLSKDILPGEFVLRFDYKENKESTPYPAERRIIMGYQNLNLWVHPMYCNNNDSTWFQKDEIENTTYSGFLQESVKKKTMISLLQNFLLNYDDNKSTFYENGIKEYEKRRESFNKWVTSQILQYKTLFISNLIRFQYIPKIEWKGSETERKQSLRENYFDEVNFSEPLMLKTTNMKEWMDGFVYLYGELATSVTLRDSLFTVAGKTAIEKARMGNPLVYGWMVDYFFNGYESFKIYKGIKMLEPYLNDPGCLTSKRQEINKRLKGIEILIPGTKAPEISMMDSDNKLFGLYAHQTEKKYLLLLFWSADCSHCKQMVGELYPLSQQMEVQQKLEIAAISVDETATELREWQQKITDLQGWTHLQAKEGLRSKVANDYYILGVPVMILINSKTKEIVALPENSEELKKYLESQ